MASNKTLDLTIRIAGKSLLAAINGTQSHVSDLARTVSRVGTAGLAAMSALATGTVAALAQCTDAAKDFESQMSNVVKYVGGLADANGKISDSLADNGKTYAQNYAEMTDAILNLSTQIPMTAEELTQLAAAAGQSGKTISDLIQYDDKGNIAGFLKDVAMMGTAMDISAEQAGDWAAKWEHSFNLNHDQVIGNLTSQLFANIYLNELDQYCKHSLKIHFYIRYMDDVIILGPDKEALHRWKADIEIFLLRELALDLNDKTSIRPVRQGVEFVGVRIWPTHMKLRKSTVGRMKREVRAISARYAAGEMSRAEFERHAASIRGLLNHTESESLRWRLNEIYLEEMDKAAVRREGTDNEPFGNHSDVERDCGKAEQHHPVPG